VAAGLAGHSAAKLSSSLPSTSSGARGGQAAHCRGARYRVGGGVSQLLSLSLELSVPSSPPPPAPQRRAGERASTCVRARAVPCPVLSPSVGRFLFFGRAGSGAGRVARGRVACSSGAYFFLRSFSSHRLPLPACLPARSLGPAKASAQKMFFAAYVWRRTRTGHVWRARDSEGSSCVPRLFASFLALLSPGRSVSVSWVGSQGAR
jgi:hypothetical protein